MTKKQSRNFGIRDSKSKTGLWKTFSEEVKGEFKFIVPVSRDLNKLQLKVNYKGVNIILKETDTKPLFIECSLKNIKKSFWFEIIKSDTIERILSYFSSKIVKSGIDNFDTQYLFKTNDKNSVNGIKNNSTLVNLILSENVFFINGKPTSLTDYSLIINVNRDVNNIQKMKAIYDLTLLLIDELI